MRANAATAGQGLAISVNPDQSRKQAMQCGGEPILVDLWRRRPEPSLQLPAEQALLVASNAPDTANRGKT